MSSVQSFPDTIIFDPVQSGIQPAGGTYLGGRLMNYLPHVDGLLMKAGGLQSSSPNLVLTRNGVGDWSLNRTAAGAESYFVRSTFGELLRTGETYRYGEFHDQPPSAGPKGIAILNFFAILNIGVVALTTATLRLGKSIYPLSGAVAAAPVQTDLVAATALATATNAAGAYLTGQVAGPSPTVFSIDDLGVVEIELAITMANTGTVRVAGLGAHCQFNYD
jgi:hypothetical protein